MSKAALEVAAFVLILALAPRPAAGQDSEAAPADTTQQGQDSTRVSTPEAPSDSTRAAAARDSTQEATSPNAAHPDTSATATMRRVGGAPSGTPGSSKGIISGVVLDRETQQPLPNARVGIYRLDPADTGWAFVAGMLSTERGGYRFSVAPGMYRIIISYQAYTTFVRDDLRVAPDSNLELRVTITPKPIPMKTVDVKGTELRGSEASVLAKQKKASYVSDAITSEQIAKSTDSNAAEALQRVTGLSVVEGRYVFVRGLGERYSSTQVNGGSVGTPEPNKRVVPLDVFPSGALDNVVVQKSYTPDQEGEFGGGVVQLNTRDFIDGKSMTQSVTSGVSQPSLNRGFLSYDGGRYDFLGFDDGTRAMPSLIKDLAGNQRIFQKSAFSQDGLTAEQIQALGRSFNKVWTPSSGHGRPNYSYAASYASGLKLFGREAGFLASASLNNGFTNESTIQNAYSGSRTSLSPLYEYKVEQSDATVLGGLLANFSVRLAPKQSLSLRSLYTRSAESESRIAQGPNYDYGTELFRVTRLGYVERGLLSNVLTGEHHIGLLPRLTGEWSAGYSEARRDEPDRRENTYESNGHGQMVLSQRNQFGLTRIFGAMKEHDRSFRASLSLPIGPGNSRDTKIKTGIAWRLRNRVSSFRRFGFSIGYQGPGGLDLSEPPELLLADENIEPGLFTLQEATRENDRYTARQEIRAAYAMVDVPVLRKLRAVGGARIEDSHQAVEARSPFVTTAKETDVELNGQDFLPAINLTYAPTDRMNVRAGFSKTVSRPELREMSPFDIYDYETGFSEIGNPKVHSTPIRGYDLRWEFFPGSRELLAVSGFHKDIEHPIEKFVEGSSGGYVLSPRNGDRGRLTGVELEARLGLATAWNAVASVLPIVNAPPALQQWGVFANYTRVGSSVSVPITTDALGNPVFRKGPLGGQSTFALNAGVSYTGAVDASVLVAAFGRRLEQVGAGQYPSTLPDIYEYPMTSLDMTVGKKISSTMRLKLSMENLLDSRSEFRQLDKITRENSPGRSFGLGLQWKQ